ncbi:MAG: hypothetical protein U0931_21440 [Vulcanimicrobiota bacterium]
MDISQKVDQAILDTPEHKIRPSLNQLEAEWSESRWVATHAGAAGLVSLGLTHLFSPKFAFLPALLGNSLVGHALRGIYPLLPIFRQLGARPRTEIDRQRYGLEQRLHPRDPLGLIESGRRHGNRFDRVRRHTHQLVNQKIDMEIQASLDRLHGAPPAAVRARLERLEHEWDIDQIIEGQAGALVNLGLALCRRDRRGYMLAGLGFAGLLSHALTGWSPTLPLLRRLGFRTRREIDREKFALLSLL